jgi:hypothetical protein
MSGAKRARLKQMLESGEIRLQPLSYPQRELWETTPVPVGDPANHICSVIHVRGSLPPDLCRASLQRVSDRQDVLRVTFLPGKEKTLQMVRSTGDANFRYRELPPAQRSDEAIEEIVQEIVLEPFDLMHGPLYRVEMVRRSADELLLVFAIHHSIADGWTLGVFVQDLCSAYVQELMGVSEPMPPVPMTYGAWDAAERAFWQPSEIERCASFWRSLLEGAPRLWSPPQPVGPSTGPLKRWVTHIPAELTSAVREIVRRTHATLFSTLLTVFQITLHKWTKVNDVVVGTPFANRARPGVRETMGYVAGVVPLRGQVDGSQRFLDALRAVHESTMDSFANFMPFAELALVLKDAPAPGHNPIFDVRFALQNHPVPDVALPGMSVKLRMRSTGTARFDLGCEVTEENETLELVWLSRASLFSHDDIERLNILYQNVLAEACRSPEDRIANFKS